MGEVKYVFFPENLTCVGIDFFRARCSTSAEHLLEIETGRLNFEKVNRHFIIWEIDLK